jgi:hypothetical protein
MEIEDVAPLRRAADITDDELAFIALGGDPTDAKQHEVPLANLG